MSFEREIITKLMENTITCDDGMDPMNEKTYTVGDTQYWKRGGKFYSWTADGGRTECTEDEYMKAISGSSTAGAPKNTEPSNDAAKKDPEPKKTDKLKFTKDNPAVIDADKPFTNDEIQKSLGIDSMDWELEPAGFGDGYKNYKVTSNGKTYFVKRMTSNKGTTTKKDPEPKKKVSKESKSDKEYRQRRAAMDHDDTESDNFRYDGVRDFDHTSWEMDGQAATIVRRPQGYGYYLQTEDYDEEFETKQDLINYLKDSGADYIGQDSENDY